MKPILISVRDFAIPVPRSGSLEINSGYGRASAEGREVHCRVQHRRAKNFSGYEAEVKLAAELERGGYRFLVSGRADGLFHGEGVKIEEIKSAFNVFDLERLLSASPDQHPYCLQLCTYGYFYYLEHKRIPALTFHLVSLRNGSSQDLALSFDRAIYEAWLERRLDELVETVEKEKKRVARRKKLARTFPFPFETPRSGQLELIQAVEDGMAERRRMLFQAPTGLGKTVGVLYPVLKQALGRGQRVVYVTPKNSQHAVALEATERFAQSGAKVKSLTITAKGKICFKNEPLCNPDYCEYARDYYTKVDQNHLADLLARKRKLDYRLFREIGEQYEVCPFELQGEACQEADVVICDYNYVFSPRKALGKVAEGGITHSGKTSLVIDEAHNLPGRAMEYYSPALSTIVLEKMRDEIQKLPKGFLASALAFLGSCISTVNTCRPEGTSRSTVIDPPREIFLEQDAQLRSFLVSYLESEEEIQPRDVVLRLCFYWSEFTAALEFVTTRNREEFFTTFQPHPSGGGRVKITCCDASEMLKACYDDFEQVVGFSATLKPFDYYARLSGLNPTEVYAEEFASPFPRKHRKILIIPEVSTKLSHRERSYGKVAEVIRRVSSLYQGNYFAFFPSFEFLARVFETFSPPEGFLTLRQEREMKASEISAVLEQLRARHTPTLVFAVQGGVFAEGVDYPGEALIGAFVVGPPLPVFDLEREKMRDYYEKHYGNGFDYAYSYPAMAKAVQAAGRVIRSETDRGLIVFMDGRFIQPSYSRSLPTDWFDEDPRELVSRSILKDVADFWNEA